MGVSKLITDCLNKEPSLDTLIKTECKYRSVEWYKKSLPNSKKQNLSILHFNVRSIVKNKHLLEEFLHEVDQCPSILAISETKLSDNKVNQALIPNYNFLFSHSSTNAGGVGLYVRSDLISIRRQDLEFDSNESENLFVEIQLTSKKVVVIGVLYRHPASNFSKFQEQLLQTLDKLGQNKQDFVLCGDFNIDLLKQEFKLFINDYQNAIYSEGCCNIINCYGQYSNSTVANEFIGVLFEFCNSSYKINTRLAKAQKSKEKCNNNPIH